MTCEPCPESSTWMAPAPRSPVVTNPRLIDSRVYASALRGWELPLHPTRITAAKTSTTFIGRPSSMCSEPDQHRRLVELARPHVQLQLPCAGVRDRHGTGDVVPGLGRGH